MATYDYMTSLKNSGRKVQVESAKRDGDGKNIANNYAKQVGYYEGMGVGTADNLTPYSENSGIAQHEPFVFQSTAGGSDVGGLCQLKALRGQSYVLNQLLNNPSYFGSALTITSSGNGVFLISGTTTQTETIYLYSAAITGHKYLVKTNQEGSDSTFRYRASSNVYTESFIFTASNVNIALDIYTGQTISGLSFIINVFDLTLMFGDGKEPTTVEEFNRLFPLPYYEYSTGELVSCQASKLITVGYNQFDGELEIGSLDSETGNVQTNSKAIRTKNFIRVIAGQTYTYEASNTGSNTFSNYIIYEYDGEQHYIGRTIKYSNNSQFVLSNNTQYIKILSYTNNVDSVLTGVQLCFHLTWDGSKTGYEPYDKHEYGLPNEVLRSAGSVYDEIKSNGTKITRIGVIDLGSLTWNYRNENGTFRASLFGGKIVSFGSVPNLLCAKYKTIASFYANDTGYESDKSITLWATQATLVVQDSDYSDADTFKTAMSGVYLFYELETPVESDSIAFQENIAIDDWGTMEFVSTYPQGNDFFYYVDYKAFVDSLGNREDIGFDASKIVSHNELTSAMSGIDLSDYVTTDTDQTITGTKNFSNGIELGSAGINFQSFIYFKRQGANIASIDNQSFSPAKANFDLGSSYDKFRDVYFTGKIKDGTNEFNADNVFNVINASDIVSNTLTQAQYDLITNGKPTLIKGTILGYTNPLIVSLEDFTTTLRGFMFTGRTLRGILINVSSRTLSDSGNDLRFDKVNQINGKVIPAYPSDTGTFVLKCVDGTLTWVAE